MVAYGQDITGEPRWDLGARVRSQIAHHAGGAG